MFELCCTHNKIIIIISVIIYVIIISSLQINISSDVTHIATELIKSERLIDWLNPTVVQWEKEIATVEVLDLSEGPKFTKSSANLYKMLRFLIYFYGFREKDSISFSRTSEFLVLTISIHVV